MAKNIKFLYKKHISDTAPDMEKLWDRIEGQLENKTDKDQTQIKVSRRNYRKFAAAAASLVFIIGGVSLYADIRSESDSVSKHSVETADKARLENREEKTYEQLRLNIPLHTTFYCFIKLLANHAFTSFKPFFLLRVSQAYIYNSALSCIIRVRKNSRLRPIKVRDG